MKKLRRLIQTRSQWSDYMERVLDIASIDSNEPFHQEEHYPFRICDLTIPQCNTGFVYMLISVRNKKAIYIGETTCLRTRLRQHNSGNGSYSTAVESLRPYVFAYVCGFDGNKTIRLHIEKHWKRNRDQKIRQGIDDPRELAYCVMPIIRDINNRNELNLRLVLLFRDNE